MTVPDAVRPAVEKVGPESRARRPRRRGTSTVTVAVEPTASAIWEATVRFQMSS